MTMNVIENPTADDVKKFCAAMEKSLLDALARGGKVVLKYRAITKPVFTPEYGQCPADEIYTGGKFVAEHDLEWS